ncbi:MAG TPA: hypothetical protein VFI23_08460 [Rhizomicrobium sp.]|nr:hypothetical protein [Rhizomicrobium sp.]
MSEEQKASLSEGGTTAFAASLALAGASREEADAFLRDQRHHLHEQLKQIHLDIWEKWLGVFLRLATSIVGVGAAGAVCWLLWQASHSNGLRIEPFSVPPDMAARGLTGEVAAAKLLDRLVALQSQTNSGRPARSYANSWGEHGIKLEIPETGISLAELDSWLREKLGHDTRVSGEIVHTDQGIAVTVRSDEGSASVTGADKDVDALMAQLAERVYRDTQPFRYAMYLNGKGRADEAREIFRDLALHGSHDDSMWAYNRWAVSEGNRSGVETCLRIINQALAVEPESVGAYDNLSGCQSDRGWAEQTLTSFRAQMAVLTDGKQTYVPGPRIPIFKRVVEARIATALGAYREAMPVFVELTRTGYPGYSFTNVYAPLIEAQTGAHELTAARAAEAELETLAPPRPGAPRPGGAVSRDMQIRLTGEDWAGVLALQGQMNDAMRFSAYGRSIRKTFQDPVLALAEAHLGRFAEAEGRVASMPGDCYPCLIVRAQIAALQGQRTRADFWFARAVSAGPSLPFADEAWGRALLARGQADAAITQFAGANKKSPHFADALEGWGEALMAKNQSHLALAQFAQAEKYAPNWGRLHMKWGEALAYAGKRDEAARHFARAAQLDLTAAEKMELTGIKHV